MASLGRIATRLKNFSFQTHWFGAKALNPLLSQSSSLEVISYDWLLDSEDYLTELINPGAVASSLIFISLNSLNMVRFPELFQPLITGTKNLSSLQVSNLSGWHDILNMLAERDDNNMFNVYLEEVIIYNVLNLVKFSNLTCLKLKSCDTVDDNDGMAALGVRRRV